MSTTTDVIGSDRAFIGLHRNRHDVDAPRLKSP